jgi:hypothetical protein
VSSGHPCLDDFNHSRQHPADGFEVHIRLVDTLATHYVQSAEQIECCAGFCCRPPRHSVKPRFFTWRKLTRSLGNVQDNRERRAHQLIGERPTVPRQLARCFERQKCNLDCFSVHP